jgi:hypothetical protein
MMTRQGITVYRVKVVGFAAAHDMEYVSILASSGARNVLAAKATIRA